MEYGKPKFFDASRLPERRKPHRKTELRSWIVEALSKIEVDKWFIVPGSQSTKARSTLSQCARNAVKDLTRQASYKHRVFEIYPSEQGVVVSRTA